MFFHFIPHCNLNLSKIHVSEQVKKCTFYAKHISRFATAKIRKIIQLAKTNCFREENNNAICRPYRVYNPLIIHCQLLITHNFRNHKSEIRNKKTIPNSMLLTNYLLPLFFYKIIVILQTEQKPKNDENSCCRCHRSCGWRYAESA